MSADTIKNPSQRELKEVCKDSLIQFESTIGDLTLAVPIPFQELEKMNRNALKHGWDVSLTHESGEVMVRIDMTGAGDE